MPPKPAPKKKLKCWEKSTTSGRPYTVCEGSRGQKGVYQKKGKKSKEPATAKDYKTSLGKKVKDFTPDERRKYNMMLKRESRLRGNK